MIGKVAVDLVTFSAPDRHGCIDAVVDGVPLATIEPWRFAGRHSYFVHWGPPWHFRRFDTEPECREFIRAHTAEIKRGEPVA